MCLETVDKKVTFQEYGVYYKVFRELDGELTSEIYGIGGIYPINGWLSEKDWRRERRSYIYTSGTRYHMGFHCFTSRESAEGWIGEEYTILHGSLVVVRKVKVKDIVAQGIQRIIPNVPLRVIVAKKMKILPKGV